MSDLGQRLFETMQAAGNAAGGVDERTWEQLGQVTRDVLQATAEAFLDEELDDRFKADEAVAEVAEVTEPHILSELDDDGEPWVRFVVAGLPDLSWPSQQANVLGFMLTAAAIDAEHEANVYSYFRAAGSDMEQAAGLILALRQHRSAQP